MKRSEFPHISDASLTPLSPRPRPKSWAGLMAYLIEALHASRRLQAARVIRQNRHLVYGQRRQHGGKAAETSSVEMKARIVSRIEQDARIPKAAMSLRAKLLIAITVAAFGILHVIADGAWRRAPASPPTEDSAPFAGP